MRISNGFGLAWLGVALLLGGCASDDDATTEVPPKNDDATTEVPPKHVDVPDPLGVYEDDFGFSHRIDAESWTIDAGSFTFVDFDSKLDTAIAQNGASNEYFAGKYSRFDWGKDEDGNLRYCQTAYDAATEEAAAAVARADESDWNKGCAGFAWSTLAAVAIIGSYVDDFGGGHVVGGQSWTMSGSQISRFEFLQLSNTDRYLIAQNATTNQYSPGKFSRFDWTLDDAGTVYFCQSKYDAETAAEALAATPADPNALSSGCGGFGWSKLTPDEG